MSIIFEYNKLIVWNPSNTTGLIFLDNITCLSKILKCKSGFSEVIQDEVMIKNKDALYFFEKLYGYYNSSRNVIIHGFIDMTLLLLGQLCFRIDPVDVKKIISDDFMEKIIFIGKEMPV